MNSKENFKLDFIGIGAVKAGTSWIADNLAKHPQIFIPEIKEITYFNPTLARLPGTTNPNHLQDLNWYHAYFEPSDKQINGEYSVQYMTEAGTAEKIYKYNPNIKIIVSLRDLPKQVHSLWLYNVQRGVVSYKTLKEAINGRPDLFANSFYFQQLKPYFDLFPKENIKVVLFEDMMKDKKGIYKELTDFIGASTIYPESLEERSNATQKPRSIALNRIIQGTRHFITKNGMEWLIPALKAVGIVQLGAFIRDKANVTKLDKKPDIDPELEKQIRGYYLKDIEQLEKLINRDLSAWKNS